MELKAALALLDSSDIPPAIEEARNPAPIAPAPPIILALSIFSERAPSSCSSS